MENYLLRCNVNGKDVMLNIDPSESLSDVLRNRLHLLSVKKGCGVGECGACTVLVNGETYNSCIYLAIWAEGKQIRTLESLVQPDGTLSDIQQAFIDEAAVQCGFCTPGFIMSSIPILESDKVFTREEIRKHLSGNMCRCTGYENIINAVEKTKKARDEARAASPKGE